MKSVLFVMAMCVTCSAGADTPSSDAVITADDLDAFTLPDLEQPKKPETRSSGRPIAKTPAKQELRPKPDAGDRTVSPEGQEWTLRYRFKEGEVLRYETAKVRELSNTRGEHTQSDLTRVHQVRRFLVTEVDDLGVANLQMQFESVEMMFHPDGGQPIVYRSSMKPQEVPRAFSIFAARLQESAQQFRVQPSGAPIDQEGELVRDDEGGTETRLLVPLPEHPVGIDDTWQYFNTVRLRVAEDPVTREPIIRTIRLRTTCRLDEVEGQIAKIVFQTTCVTKVRTPSVKGLLIEAFPKGHMLLDMQAGRITERVVRNDNRVFGVHGPNSMLTTSAESVEKLLPAEVDISAR